MRFHRMKPFRVAALLAASLALAACGTAARMINATGRALHLHAETTGSPDDFSLESKDVRESLAAGGRIDLKPQAAPTGLAQR